MAAPDSIVGAAGESYPMYIVKTVFLLLLSFSALSATGAKEREVKKREPDLIVSYYGRPHSRVGVLGRYSVESAVRKIRAKAAEYKKLAGVEKVTPGFDIIYDLATSSPGRDGNYIAALPEKSLMRYIDAAEKNNFIVVLDLQLGKKTPASSVKSVLKYLKHKSVHIAIDPEFYVGNLKVRPGKKIGHISAAQVNAAQKIVSDYLHKNGIGRKFFIVHMFTNGMVRHKSSLKNFDNIDLIANLDGHGSPTLKINIYNGLYTRSLAAKASSGFKLFFTEDKPYMMSPAQALGLKKAQGRRIKTRPHFINYQ